jgi:hypothetical protein
LRWFGASNSRKSKYENVLSEEIKFKLQASLTIKKKNNPYNRRTF